MALIIVDRNVGTAFFLRRDTFTCISEGLLRRENYTEVAKARKARDAHGDVFLLTRDAHDDVFLLTRHGTPSPR